ncbi:GNAT family N-acetyltransferase [Nocardioides sp.]|uniref:GNAT family N-acetyltransferase n=1 Tax=Nocardioides sp. TaxID=35761 RepID=UPI002D7FCEED|nr:GNAT family N-acetyltransferase [Nocardioides sp.]HET8960909.1 GNAT family N-acetyltransferase [Nocardioides sp.]
MTTDVAAGLPAGLTTRALTMADAAAVTAVISAQELDDVGEVIIEEADIVADWQRPGYDVTASSIGVFDDDRLVAYAESGSGGRGDAAVHPDYRGRGIGTRLAAWMRARAGEQGQPEVGMPVPQGSPGDVLLEGLGYRVRWTSWVLQLPEGASIPARPLPEGYVVREAGPDEYEAAWTVQEDAFLEWSVRERETYAQWESSVVRRPGFEPWNLRVVADPGGVVVAMGLVQLNDRCAYIARLATRRDQRGRGLAQALLVDAFAVAAEHGATRSELSTDSRTGALSLYEKVGMEVTSVWVNRAIETGAPR